jgi:hypothetical protein
MHSTEIQCTKAVAPKKEFRVLRVLALGAFLVVALGTVWTVTRTRESRVFSSQTLPDDNRPAFISTSERIIEVGPLSNLPLRKKITGLFLKLKYRIAPPKPNPAGYSFPPSADRRCSVQGLLNQCSQVTGTRYLIAREARGDSIYFGHAKTLNGTQWVAAFERALQQDGYGVIRQRPGLVKIIPQDVVAQYERAGLVQRTK